jgi:hypothetical protein
MAMYIFDYYGVSANDVTTLVARIASFLNISFQAHESTFWGEYFSAHLDGGGSVRVLPNFHDGDWRDEEFKQYNTLVEVNEAPCPDDIKGTLEKIGGIAFLYRSEVEERKSIRRYKCRDGLFYLSEEKILY